MARGVTRRPFAFGTLLHHLQDPARERLLALGTTVRFRPGHRMIRQGDGPGPVFLLMNSVVKITAQAENGAVAMLAVRVSGDIVGEMAVLSGTERSATVTACGDTMAQVIRGPVFVEFMQRNAALGVALSRLTGDRLRWANDRRLDFAGYDADVCLARLLLALAGRHGAWTGEGLDIGVALTQAELGGLIGAKEGTVQKAMRSLRGRRFLRNRKQSIVISDVKGLAAYADVPVRGGLNPH